jgi:hypothetical protein
LAAELLVQLDPSMGKSLLDQALEDPSLPVRAMAVEQAIERAKDLKDSAAAIQEYRRILESARHPRQVSEILAALKKRDEVIRPIDHFKFIPKWWTLAPFDNVGGGGFHQVYPVEEQFVKDGTVELAAKFAGKKGSIEWREVASEADDGKIDLNPVYNKEKGAVCYVYAELVVDKPQAAQVRLGCICANKVWINGNQVLANEVYHTGSMIDQYMAEVELKEGVNRILAKICQNEQTEPWAQDWDFQLRITDPTGKGLVSLAKSK